MEDLMRLVIEVDNGTRRQVLILLFSCGILLSFILGYIVCMIKHKIRYKKFNIHWFGKGSKNKEELEELEPVEGDNYYNG